MHTGLAVADIDNWSCSFVHRLRLYLHDLHGRMKHGQLPCC